MHTSRITRRSFLKTSAILSTGYCMSRRGFGTEISPPSKRRFHASLSIQALERYPDLLFTVAAAGVDAIWVAAFLHGQWQHPPELTAVWKKRIEALGLEMHHITVPLGHPSFSGEAPDYMKGTVYHPWQHGLLADGKDCYGVCVHPPICEENTTGLEVLHATAPGLVLLDDDFRLAVSPHDIGGCFCGDHKKTFLEKHGYEQGHWEELLEAVKERKLTSVLRHWLEGCCDELTDCFRIQQQSLPSGQLGIMVMYMGSEKAGIRLSDYSEVPFRVGELMFSDATFSQVKGKTDELFSVLFHRRFTSPELSYSESTAWPPDGLSAHNLAAKLAVSTLSDVRNTMLMSGLEPYPLPYWDTLGPAISKHRKLHELLAGHKPAGPFKHYWGEAGRWVGDSNPYSLFLATGVPFEVVDNPTEEGYVFLGEADAKALLKDGEGLRFVTREAPVGTSGSCLQVPETLEALYALKHSLLEKTTDFPYVKEDLPVVCAWYPTAGSVALWNLQEQRQCFTLHFQGRDREIEAQPLELVVVPLNA